MENIWRKVGLKASVEAFDNRKHLVGKGASGPLNCLRGRLLSLVALSAKHGDARTPWQIEEG